MARERQQYQNMTIRQRINISNVLMLLIPLVLSAGSFLSCYLLLTVFTDRTQKLATMDNEDVLITCGEIVERYKLAISTGPGAVSETMLESLDENISDNQARLLIRLDGEDYHVCGIDNAADSNLMKAIESLGDSDNCYITIGNRQLYTKTVYINGLPYRFYIFINRIPRPYRGVTRLSVIIGVLLTAALLVAVVFINRFLTQFVFSKIKGPLNLLSHGVHQLRDGNLSYRLSYHINDEFRPICEDFNDMAEELEQSRALLQRQEENRKALIAGISHDLRSPLTSIGAYADGLIEGVAKTPEDERRYLDRIKTNADSMIRMVSRLFMFSKMDLDEYPCSPELLQLDEEVRELISAVSADYEENDMTIALSELAPVRVLADPEQFRTVMTNLLENALKYRNEAQGHIEIALRKENGDAVLTVTDDGPGVPEEALPHLFEVFYRSDPSRKNIEKGSGLGLAIVRKAVERMNGTVTAENTSPHGLTIRIVLPEENHG